MPSWGYWIDRYGATSLFETWDIERNIGDASRNHPSMGAVAAWMYKALAGIGQTTHSVALNILLSDHICGRIELGEVILSVSTGADSF